MQVHASLGGLFQVCMRLDFYARCHNEQKKKIQKLLQSRSTKIQHTQKEEFDYLISAYVVTSAFFPHKENTFRVCVYR